MAKMMILIIGGPNGAGKSSITDEVVEMFGAHLIKLNADERTLQLKQKHPEKPLPEINLLAAQQIDATVEKHIQEGRSFYVETVLSSPKYQDDVLKAKEAGFTFALVYVSLSPPELSAERVKVRAQKGGHDVNWDTAIARYYRSHAQLEWFANQADMFVIFDNSMSDKAPILLAAKMAGQEIVHHVKGANPEVDRVLSVLQKNKSANLAP